MHQARAGDADHARTTATEMVVVHQVVDIPGVTFEIDLSAAERHKRDADDAVQPVEQSRRVDWHIKPLCQFPSESCSKYAVQERLGDQPPIYTA